MDIVVDPPGPGSAWRRSLCWIPLNVSLVSLSPSLLKGFQHNGAPNPLRTEDKSTGGGRIRLKEGGQNKEVIAPHQASRTEVGGVFLKGGISFICWGFCPPQLLFYCIRQQNQRNAPSWSPGGDLGPGPFTVQKQRPAAGLPLRHGGSPHGGSGGVVRGR